MADVTSISAALVAVVGAASALISAAKNPGDLSKVRDEIKAFAASLSALDNAIGDLRAQIDPQLREHLDALAVRVLGLEGLVARVVKLEEWRSKRREDLRSSGVRGEPGATDARLKDHDRRLDDLEDRERARDANIGTVRELIAGIIADVRNIPRRS